MKNQPEEFRSMIGLHRPNDIHCQRKFRAVNIILLTSKAIPGHLFDLCKVIECTGSRAGQEGDTDTRVHDTNIMTTLTMTE